MCVLLLRIKPWGKEGKCSAIYLCNSIHKIGTEVFCIWDRCKTYFPGWHVVRFQWVHIPFLSTFPFLWGRLRHLWPSLHAELYSPEQVFYSRFIPCNYYRRVLKILRHRKRRNIYFFSSRRAFSHLYTIFTPPKSPYTLNILPLNWKIVHLQFTQTFSTGIVFIKIHTG